MPNLPKHAGRRPAGTPDAAHRGWKRFIRFVATDAWAIGAHSVSRQARWAIDVVKLGFISVQKFVEYGIPMFAGTCTYLTAVALIPILMVVLSLLKGMGFFEDQYLGELALKFESGSIFRPLLGYLQAMLEHPVNFGAIGFATFVVLAFGTFRTLEDTFNIIWGTREKRALFRQFTDYLFLIVVIPVLVSAGLFFYYKAGRHLPHGWPASLLRFLALGAATWASLFLFYRIMPHARVKSVPVAFGAALVTLVLALFAWAVQTGIVSVGRSNAFLSPFLGAMVVIPLSLMFLNLVWMILLIGGVFIFSFQNLRGFTGSGEFLKLSARLRAAITLTTATELARFHAERRGAVPLLELARGLCIHPNFVLSACRVLRQAGLAGRVMGSEECYVLLVPPSAVRVSEVLRAVHAESQVGYEVRSPALEAVGFPVLDKAEALLAGSGADASLAALAHRRRGAGSKAG